MNYKHFGIPFFTNWKKIFLEKLEKSIKNWEKNFWTTPNPEMMLLQSKNKRFQNILKSAKWNLPDWFWLIIWSFLEKKNPKNLFSFLYYLTLFPFSKKDKNPINKRICGSDIFYDICEISAKNNFTIFLLWWWKWIAKKAKEKLEKKYEKIKIVWISEWYEKANSNETFELIKEKKPQIIFVAMWAPFQEFWIEKNFDKFSSLKFAIWVWWTFDFVIWKQKRAPKIMRKFWLEWLFRLIKEPSRFLRIFDATFWYLFFVYKNLVK